VVLMLVCPSVSAQMLPAYNLFGEAKSSDELVYRAQKQAEWVKEFDAWWNWYEVWANSYGKVIETFTDGSTRIMTIKRKPKPAPPIWLLDECQDAEGSEGILLTACQHLARWKEDLATTFIRMQANKQIADKEKSSLSRFEIFLHFDGLWFMGQSNVLVYAPAGMHVSFAVTKRFQIFLTPGMLLLNMPTDKGRAWQPAYDWGVGYRLTTFQMPLVDRRVGLHFNFARAWIFGGPAGAVDASINMLGLSISTR